MEKRMIQKNRDEHDEKSMEIMIILEMVRHDESEKS